LTQVALLQVERCGVDPLVIALEVRILLDDDASGVAKLAQQLVELAVDVEFALEPEVLVLPLLRLVLVELEVVDGLAKLVQLTDVGADVFARPCLNHQRQILDRVVVLYNVVKFANSFDDI